MSAPGSRLKRWRYGVIGAGLLIVIALMAVLWLQKPRVDDPVYEGKRLSEYVAQLSLTRSPGFLSPRSRTLGPPGAEYSRTWLIRKDEREMSELEREAAEQRAEDALQALGAQCLPLLIDVIQRRIDASAKAGHPHRNQAVTGFMILRDAGVDLKPATPRLMELARDRDRSVREAARLLLRLCDPPSRVDL